VSSELPASLFGRAAGKRVEQARPSRVATVGTTADLPDRLAALREVVDLGTDRLPAAATEPARALLAKAGARLALGDATVVALAGATGSGKSTLFNALAGADISAPGVRRPTTSSATAAVWGTDVPDRLLDWLQVPRRHALGAVGTGSGDPELDGLVLLDLPDHDSTAVAHRLEVDRLVGLVDLLVWVMDPQKYADAAIHDRYLKPLATHASLMTVVLNQVDRLSPADAERCVVDLRGLLDREGLAEASVLPVSARTGTGLPELRGLLAERVAARAAATARVAADLDAVVEPLTASCGGRPGEVGDDDRERLVEALAGAAGVDAVVRAVEGSHRQRAVAAAGWPPVRMARKLRPDPLRRLHLSDTPTGARSSLPAATGVQKAQVATAVRRAADGATADLPDPWPARVREAAAASEEALPAELDRVVTTTELGVGRRPRWERAAGLVQTLLLVVAVVGGVWLLGLAALAYLQLPDLPVPRVGRAPLPTVLLLGGLLAGLLLALLARWAAAAGARRRGRAVRKRLHARVEAVAQEHVFGPLEAELAVYADYCEAVARSRGLVAPSGPRRRRG
jgi:GTP-binding protein EngB required for normal cell division